MARRLFCEISPLCYQISYAKCCAQRRFKDAVSGSRFAVQKSAVPLPELVSRHASLIRRRLGNQRMDLQENKAVNLGLASPHIHGLLIRPGETFSLWRCVGSVTARKGYRVGLTITKNSPAEGVGGGMCQLSNLLHWMALHSELTVCERHHHDRFDLFPDYKRQVPFGTGTSILYNYLDYRLYNGTARTYQLLLYVEGEYLRGELRATQAEPVRFHIHTENERFVQEADGVYRVGQVYRDRVDKRTGDLLEHTLLQENHAKVMYDTAGLAVCD